MMPLTQSGPDTSASSATGRPAKAGPASHAVKARSSAARSNTGGTLEWGSALVRFLKLDGFPAYLKVENFTQYYKELTGSIFEAIR